jgi:hypothetical protein
MMGIKVKMEIKRLAMILIAAAIMIFLIDIIAYFGGLYELPLFGKYLNPTVERNIPTLISSFSFFLLSLLMLDLKRKFYGYFFIYLSVDDLLMIHEQVGTLVGKYFLKDKVVGYYWHYVYDPILILAFGFLFVYLFSNFLKNSNIKGFLFLLVSYFLIALSQLADFYEGLILSLHHGFSFFYLSKSQTIHIIRSIEETMEIIANAFLILSISYVLQDRIMHVSFELRDK